MNGMISQIESIQEILVNATRALCTTLDFGDARLEAELLLAHTLKISRTMLLARLEETIEPDLAAQYASIVARRSQHEPLAYILGHREFYGLDFVVDRRVLIPRHETELLVEIALERARRMAWPVIVDVGTGSGAIALSLARHLTDARIFATDLSCDALAVARINASRLNLDRVQFLADDLLTLVEEPFELLVANLPYIPSTRYGQLAREVRDYEPRLALDGGFDGLAVMRRLSAQLKQRARPGSKVLFEISEEQGKLALELAHRELPLAMAQLHRDLEGLDRVLELSF